MTRAERVFGSSLSEVQAARQFARSTVAQWDVATDDVVLVTSELVTNALVHAAGAFSVSLVASDGIVTLEVTDRGGGEPAVRPLSRDDAGGRGLLIVAGLCRKWGVRPAPAGGKTVWAEFAPDRR